MGRLAGKVAVVFGGARGIGLATVKEFVAEGATVFSSDLRELAEPVEGVRHSLVDATDEEQVDEFVRGVLAEAGRIDVLFNNVGSHLGKSLTDTTLAEFDNIFAVNVRAAFLGTRAVLPRMIEQKAGSIITTSSNGGVMGRPGDPVYNATKHALVGMMKSIAVAHAHQGIRANTINPGAIDTDMLRGTLASPEDFEAKQHQLTASTPAARVGEAWEVAKAVVFLASDESRFINGVALPIDGAKAAGAMPGNRYSLDFELGVR
ncbi:SDR family NAD(P)-dependent oxidoreductase [Amycolatopsis regifaucium]|uniref:Short-chain dehydrogenase n=1 Tax=Amycolatopsis regifaucium TaxID=546365 RepID=A0A154MHV0_9PSEU|nr:SDR family oxidoreductase [Amycolatopsis regifaucium]KZB83955.1 short-chain dehydrogenase [Amycolatopsis regifaucium]OKA06604.1 short-chain dehydrogenase [Amycolatopsis regifaucium]SFH21500.1 NAD(P)-dependent dehydrogenase, short-chain alcohol dehydrogenase family [Amycolatopsis regifaucium]